MSDISEDKNPETDFKRRFAEKICFNLNSTTENQITVGQQFYDDVEK